MSTSSILDTLQLYKDHIEAQKLYFRFDRTRNIQLTATNALNLLRKFILAES